MHYTIYKITNIINGKFYIGKHQTKDLNDGYFGSGKILKRAIAKHGKENFTKEILFVFDNESEMNAKERELVTLNESSYNLCPGGQGGFGYINASISIEERKKRGSLGGKNVSKEKRSLAASLSWKENKLSPPPSFSGKKHSPEAREKMRQKALQRVIKRNSLGHFV